MLKQIELERAPGLQLQHARATIVVPETFNPAFKSVFPEIYLRVQRELIEKHRMEEVLIEIFSSFLSRWGKDFKQLEDYHRFDLDTTSKATIAQANGHPLTGFVFEEPPSDDFKKNKLPEEILHSVEQELRMRLGKHAA